MIRVCHFAFGIKRVKSNSPSTEKIKPMIYEHDVCAYLMGLAEKIQNEPTVLIDNRLGALSRVSYQAIGELSKLADKGNKEAAKVIFNNLSAALHWFDDFCHEKPEMFESIARKGVYWPALISPQKAVRNRNEKLMEKLHLAADVKSVDLKGNWSYAAPEIEVALWLKGTMALWREQWQPENIRRHKEMIKKFNQEIGRPANYKPPKPKPIPTKPEWEEEFRLSGESQKMAKNLPPFNKQTCEQWFKASWPLFRSRWKEDFENRKCFARFIPIAQKNADTAKKKLRGELRKYITKRIKLAFEQIAPEVDLKMKS